MLSMTILSTCYATGNTWFIHYKVEQLFTPMNIRCIYKQFILLSWCLLLSPSLVFYSLFPFQCCETHCWYVFPFIPLYINNHFLFYSHYISISQNLFNLCCIYQFFPFMTICFLPFILIYPHSKLQLVVKVFVFLAVCTFLNRKFLILF